VSVTDDLCFFLGPHRRHDLVASFQKEFENVG
jgi:hypothetical protein